MLRMPFQIKITQLQLERNYGEAVRLLQARLAQYLIMILSSKRAVIRWPACFRAAPCWRYGWRKDYR